MLTISPGLQFSHFIEQEIAKVNEFYAIKLDKARRFHVDLETQMEVCAANGDVRARVRAA